MTFPIKKRISHELFIDRLEALYIIVTRIRCNTNEGDQRIGIVLLRILSFAVLFCGQKKYRNERAGDNQS